MLKQLTKLNFLITKKQRKVLVILTVLLLIGMFFEVLGLGILVPVISLILDSEFIQKYPEAERVMAFLGGISQREFTFLFLALVVLIYIVKTLFLVTLTYHQNRFLSNLMAYFSKSLFQKYMSQPYGHHIKRNNASLLKNIQVEVNYVNAFCTGLIHFFVEVSLLFAVATTIVFIEPIGAISMGLFLGILSFVFFHFTKNKLQQWGDNRQQLDKTISKLSLEGLSGIKDLKVLGRTSYFLKSFNQNNDIRARIISNRLTLSQLPRFYLEFVMVLGLVAFIFLMILLQKDTSEIITILGVFVAATFRMIPSINKIIGALQNLKFFNASLDVLYDEMKTSDSATLNNERIEVVKFSDKIRVKNLSFSYGKEMPMVIEDLDFSFKKGETIGFKGVSGSGKSTLIDIIIGLYTPTNGVIEVDGFDIQKNLRGWQNNIGYVSQDIFLTNDTLARNVAFGVLDKDINLDSVNNTLRMVQLSEFVKDLKEGVNTTVGERGVQLSGGQRQRIGIARALYHNPEILVLDEATASLDMQTETEVMKAIDALKGQKTILIIAHRLTTLEGCDMVYEIKKGKLMNQSDNMKIIKNAKQ
jgi:ATP-binding cassette, subfamily B, bacterial PglK